ncbi:NAD-dependent epimerase/dehydratase family protein [Polyangium sorediatum]|uniref:NAD-dependent epimerase/dehydratase family protein n=1 Tax=Polyangium sorediatum TaxID=889274 RepID=A0ABT6P3F4_9BACT|nr:NAD-dependent epimerase/dehydratase family protein [Polyangium sorediatum]MDI1435141.1 NAD-dependent epimerase/dehydratase family protein [Polyangium sorediatum]
MKLLVTGIAGFIGSHLAERLLDRGDTVVGLDSFDPYYARSIKERNLARVRGRAHVVEADLLDEAAVAEILSATDFDVVVHLASLAGVRPSLAVPARYQRVNVEGTTRLAELARARGVRRFVFASSSSVYGASKRLPFAEDDRADEPMSSYAASKRAAELVLRALVHTHDLGVTCLRYFTVYGPRQRPEMAIHAFCRAIDRGETIELYGTGTASRDYTYVDDVIDGTLRAIDRVDDGYRVYNLGAGGTPTTLNEVVALLAEALGKPARVHRGPAIVGDVEHTIADIRAAKAALGYEPRTGIREGIRKFVDWYSRT